MMVCQLGELLVQFILDVKAYMNIGDIISSFIIFYCNTHWCSKSILYNLFIDELSNVYHTVPFQSQ